MDETENIAKRIECFDDIKINDRVIKYNCHPHKGSVIDLRGGCQVLVALDNKGEEQWYGGWCHWKQLEHITET